MLKIKKYLEQIAVGVIIFVVGSFILDKISPFFSSDFPTDVIWQVCLLVTAVFVFVLLRRFETLNERTKKSAAANTIHLIMLMQLAKHLEHRHDAKFIAVVEILEIFVATLAEELKISNDEARKLLKEYLKSLN